MSKTLVQYGPADGSDTAYVEIVADGSTVEYKVNGSQSSAITDIATDASGTEISVAVNDIIAALETAGIVAS